MRACTRSLVLVAAIAGCETAVPGSGTLPETSAVSAASAGRDSAAPAIPVVYVSGHDYTFSAPASIPSGWTTFRFLNEGAEPHHVSLIRLEDGYTIGDFMEAAAAGDPMPAWATYVGGANSVARGGEANATVHLEPGNYLLACFIPSADHVPHLLKGMVKPLLVTEEANGAPAPGPDLEMMLTNYAIETDRAVSSGERTIRVTNRSADLPHEVILVQLAPGKSLDDMIGWFRTMAGPPPAEFLGGVAALSPGESNTFTARFEPGKYAWICPLIERPGTAPHTDHGMMRQFTVGDPS